MRHFSPPRHLREEPARRGAGFGGRDDRAAGEFPAQGSRVRRQVNPVLQDRSFAKGDRAAAGAVPLRTTDGTLAPGAVTTGVVRQVHDF